MHATHSHTLTTDPHIHIYHIQIYTQNRSLARLSLLRRIWQSIVLFNCYIHTIYTSIDTHTRIHVQSAAQVSIHTRYSKRIHLYLVDANIQQRKGRRRSERQNQLLYETNQMHMLSIAMHMLITLINNPMYLKLYTNTLAYTIHTHTPKQMYILNTDICISYHEFTSACLCVLLLFIFVSISVYPHFVYSILSPSPPTLR